MATYSRLTDKLLALSNSNDYEEAKKEWRITGNVWKHGINEESRLGFRVRDHVSGHPNACLCGHKIVYHFEIENTENQTKEIVGSTCINNWMVLRHMEEKLKIDRRTITDKMIEEWKANAVHALIKDAWWEENGEEFTNTFDEIKELDLRINVKKTGKTYWEESVKDYRPETFIRKSSNGLYGTPTYEMASIVWRWNHPDNPRRQRDSKRGTPNDKLMEDLVLFKINMQKHLDIVNRIDSIDSNRIIHLGNVDSYITRKLVTVNDNDLDQQKFLQGCKVFGIRPFTTGEAVNSWERRFLRDMRRRVVRLELPSPKQCDSLINILHRRNDILLESKSEE
tara:strand:- start:4619 stop:5632 length:1014 start_codon:yes stop_codon:yes gene_type:complete